MEEFNKDYLFMRVKIKPEENDYHYGNQYKKCKFCK